MMETNSPASASFAPASAPVGAATTPEVGSGFGQGPYPTRKKRGDHEFRLQCAIRDLLDRACPKHIPWTALENGERRPKASRQRCARKGVKNGWPDFQFILAGGLYAGLELKTARDKLRGIEKGRTSPEQEQTGEAIKAAGALYHVAYGWDEAVAFLTRWGIVKASSVIRHQEPAPPPQEREPA